MTEADILIRDRIRDIIRWLMRAGGISRYYRTELTNYLDDYQLS